MDFVKTAKNSHEIRIRSSSLFFGERSYMLYLFNCCCIVCWVSLYQQWVWHWNEYFDRRINRRTKSQWPDSHHWSIWKFMLQLLVYIIKRTHAYDIELVASKSVDNSWKENGSKRCAYTVFYRLDDGPIHALKPATFSLWTFQGNRIGSFVCVCVSVAACMTLRIRMCVT